MAREIKIRMWNGIAKKYHYDVENVLQCLAQQNVHDGLMPTRGFTIGYDHIAEGSVFEYFTGVKDKNGVDIYEGDVVKFSTRRHHLGRDKGLQTITFKSDVIFDDGCFMISETCKYDTYLYSFSNECEIIGNIHESEVKNG